MLSDLDHLTSASAPFWPKQQRKRFPTFKESERDEPCDFVIVGGGWVGLFSAYFLAKAGRSVAILDKDLIAGEASGNSGGVVLDKFEGDIRELMKQCGKENTGAAARILAASHAATSVIAEVASVEKFDAGYKNLGHITPFRNEREKNKYIKSHQQVRDLVPDLYPEDIELLTPEETGAPEFFKAGAAYSPKGGIFNPCLVVEGMLELLKNLGIKIYEESEVTALEAAPHRAVRVLVGDASLEVRQVILAGGATSHVIENYCQFSYLQPVIAGMLATPPLVGGKRFSRLIERLKNRKGPEVPVMCGGIGAPYYRFTEDNRLLFGSGGRTGKNEFPEIVKDIGRDLFRVFPSLKGRVDLERCDFWGRMLYHDSNDLPFVYALNAERNLVDSLPEVSQLPTIPIIGIAGLGGLGNNFGPYLGQVLAKALCGDQAAHEILRLFHTMAPTEPLNRKMVQQRLKMERML
jgi:gamma-glutamylputrescine oxidase